MVTQDSSQMRTALILYGTETGTSQDLAEELGRMLERLRFSCSVKEFDSLAAADLHIYTITVFVVATTGQGEFPSNARKFWTSLLRKRLTANFLAGVEYALVGLGDSSYPKFNWAARKLEKRVKQLGAAEFFDACEADEQGDDGTDGAFVAWSQRFRSAVISKYPLAENVLPIADNEVLPSKWRLCNISKSPVKESSLNGYAPRAVFEIPDNDTRLIPGSFRALLKSNVRVTPVDHWQDVRFLTLWVPSVIDYFPGDALSIMPKNIAKDVDALIDQMVWNEVADTTVELIATSKLPDISGYASPPIPYVSKNQGITLRQILTDYLDIMAIPRRSFFAAISNYTQNAMHRERLLEFTDPQYLDEYYDYATRPRRSILEILQEFDSVKIPWQEAANVFPLLRPRQFSIASGGVLKHKGEGGTTFELLIAIVKYRTVIKRIREGICTRYLAVLPVESTLNVVLKTEGRFHARPETVPNNHLLIGPGTGIAPLRALIHEKQMLSQGFSSRSRFSFLIFGARNSSSDFFFEDEWKQLTSQAEKIMATLQIVSAFSRDQKAKVYVQDRVREYAQSIYDLLHDGEATVVICGSSGQMPKAVREALLDVLANTPASPSNSESTLSRYDAEQLLSSMEKEGRYKQETW